MTQCGSRPGPRDNAMPQREWVHVHQCVHPHHTKLDKGPRDQTTPLAAEDKKAVIERDTDVLTKEEENITTTTETTSTPKPARATIITEIKKTYIRVSKQEKPHKMEHKSTGNMLLDVCF